MGTRWIWLRCLAAAGCLALAGCSTRAPVAVATQPTRVERTFSFSSYRLRMIHSPTGAKAEVHVSVHCDYSALPDREANLVEQAAVPYSQGGRLLFLYIVNSVLTHLHGQPVPRGFRVEEVAEVERMRREGGWSVDFGRACYSRSALAMRDADGSIYWLGEAQANPDDWTELNAESWPDFWRAVDGQSQVGRLFEDRAK